MSPIPPPIGASFFSGISATALVSTVVRAAGCDSVHELHGLIALLIQQPNDFRRVRFRSGEVCFNGGLLAQLAPVGPVFAKHDISLPYSGCGCIALSAKRLSETTVSLHAKFPKFRKSLNPRAGNEIERRRNRFTSGCRSGFLTRLPQSRRKKKAPLTRAGPLTLLATDNWQLA